MTKIVVRNKNRSRVYIFVLFIMALIISTLILTTIHTQWHQERINELVLLLNGQGRSIEANINRSLSSAVILAAWVKANNGNIEQFDYFASQTINSLGGVTNLQLAPDGIVKHISPLEGHQAAIGHNILKDDKRRKEALLAIASDQMTLAGPFELIQGGIAVIGRKAVFLDKKDPETGVIDPNRRYFWGYASALIYLDDILSTTNLTSLLAQGFYYQLWRYHPDTGNKQIFASNSSSTISQDSNYTIKLPNTIWHLNIEPIISIDHSNSLVTTAILLLIIDILICGLTYQVLRSPSQSKGSLQELQQRVTGDKKIISRQKHQIRQLQTIVDNSTEAVLICDINGHIKYINQKLISQSGYSPQEIIGHTPNIFRSPKTSLKQHKHLWHVILSGKIWQGKLCNRHKNGELYWIDLKVTPVTDNDDNIVEFIAVSSPVNQRPQQLEPESQD